MAINVIFTLLLIVTPREVSYSLTVSQWNFGFGVCKLPINIASLRHTINLFRAKRKRIYNFVVSARIVSKVRFGFGNKSFYQFGIRSCLASKSRRRFNWRHQCDVNEHFGVSRQQFHRLEPVWYRWQTPWLSSMKKFLQSVNHDQLQVLKKREEQTQQWLNHGSNLG